jgi:isoquinoline 1-oxidoreductase beta subunit
MLVAEELEANWQHIRVVNCPVSELYKNPLIGIQITGGSTSVRSRWEGLRKAGAAAKEMLIEAAAQHWNVEPKQCEASHSQVFHPATGNILKYSQLAEAAAKLTPPTAPRLKNPKQFKLIGQPIQRLDTPEKNAQLPDHPVERTPLAST